ncbi:hypothetical protein EJ07DRAFT_176574 [Lizonia empirigonia]|nr:hypothetical protein EJ07DRAFT_176574 [Lizonia empirigonia]
MSSEPTSASMPAPQSQRRLDFICSLPTKILLNILDYMPVSASAHLALANRQMYNTINVLSVPFDRLHQPGREFERARILTRFDYLYLDTWICFACGRVHPLSDDREKRHLYRCSRDWSFYSLDFINFDNVEYYWPKFASVMRALRHSPMHFTADLINVYYPRGRHTGSWISYLWSRDSLARRDVASDHLLYRQRFLRPIPLGRDTAFCLRPDVFVCPHFFETKLDGLIIDHTRTHDVLDDAVGLATTFNSIDLRKGFVYKALRCTKCISEVVISVKPTSMADIPPDDQSMHGAPMVLEIAQYFDLGLCKAPDEAEWDALMGGETLQRTPGPSILQRFGDFVDGRAQLPSRKTFGFMNEGQSGSMETWDVKNAQHDPKIAA